MSRRFYPDAVYRIFLDLLVLTRTEQGVTQEELAKRLELSPAQVAAFENGDRQLDFVETREWCLALGVSFLAFMIELDAKLFSTPDAELDTDAPGANPTDANPTEGGAK